MSQLEQGRIQNPVTRRTLLKAAGVLLLAACENKPAPSPEIYHGVIKGLDGKPLISDERFGELTRALVQSSDPLLEKAGTELRRIHNNSNNPKDLPSVVDETTTPLIITRDNSYDSLAIISPPSEDQPAPTSPTPSDELEPDFLIGNGFTQRPWKYVLPSIFGINVGAGRHPEKQIPMEEAIFLAKEHLSIMLTLRIFAEYGDYFLEPGFKFLELDGTEMMDTEALLRAGHSVGIRDMVDDKSLIWRLTDIVPFLMLAPSVTRLIESGQLPKESNILGPFYAAKNLVNDYPQLREVISILYEDWSNSANITGPQGYTQELFYPQVLEAVDIFYEYLYGENRPQ